MRAVSERKSVILRLDPAIHDAVARWAQDELRSSNAQIEFLSAALSRPLGGCREQFLAKAAPDKFRRDRLDGNGLDDHLFNRWPLTRWAELRPGWQ